MPQQKMQVFDRYLGVMLAVDKEHRRRGSIDQPESDERHLRTEGEEVLERADAVDRSSSCKQIHQVFSRAKSLTLPFGLKIVMNPHSLGHDCLQTRALDDCHLGGQ